MPKICKWYKQYELKLAVLCEKAFDIIGTCPLFQLYCTQNINDASDWHPDQNNYQNRQEKPKRRKKHYKRQEKSRRCLFWSPNILKIVSLFVLSMVVCKHMLNIRFVHRFVLKKCKIGQCQ